MDVYLLMKSVRFTLLRPLFFSAAVASVALSSQRLAAEETPAVAVDPYTAAVRSYVEAATKEVNAIRAELLSNEKLGKKERFASVRSGLETCEELVSRLKSAGQGQFDVIKSEYERSRNELLKKLGAARQGS